MQAPCFTLHCPRSVCTVSSFQVNHLKNILPSTLRLKYDTKALTLRVSHNNYKKKEEIPALSNYTPQHAIYSSSSYPCVTKTMASKSHLPVCAHIPDLQSSRDHHLLKWPWKHHMLTVTGHLFWWLSRFQSVSWTFTTKPSPVSDNFPMTGALSH